MSFVRDHPKIVALLNELDGRYLINTLHLLGLCSPGSDYCLGSAEPPSTDPYAVGGVGGGSCEATPYPDVCRVRHMFLRVSQTYHENDKFDKSQTQPGSGEGCSNITSGTPVIGSREESGP
jgi:hypothetical protein